MNYRHSVKQIVGFACILALLVTAGCESNSTQDEKTKRIVTAVKRSVPTPLYYSGNVQPIRVFNIVSPAAGVVKKVDFKYGGRVTKGEALVVIDSDKLQDSYRKAITSFLSAKDKLASSQTKYQNSLELQKYGLISEESLRSDKTQFDSANLTYFSAIQTLKKSLADLPAAKNAVDIQRLSLEDVKTVEKILEQRHDLLSLTAPANGIAMFPTKKSSAGSSDSGDKITVGSQMKKGQVVVAIGDIQGLSITLNVDETNIDRIKPGQKVTVTMPAFPQLTLHGEVKTVGSQAKSSSGDGGGLAEFPVTVIVPELKQQEFKLYKTKAKEKLIRIGMSAKVEIIIKNPPQIMIPIKAVTEKGGQSMVTVINPKTGQSKQVPVTTGSTSLSDVEILKGLKAGDKVVVYD